MDIHQDTDSGSCCKPPHSDPCATLCFGAEAPVSSAHSTSNSITALTAFYHAAHTASPGGTCMAELFHIISTAALHHLLDKPLNCHQRPRCITYAMEPDSLFVNTLHCLLDGAPDFKDRGHAASLGITYLMEPLISFLEATLGPSPSTGCSAVSRYSPAVICVNMCIHMCSCQAVICVNMCVHMCTCQAVTCTHMCINMCTFQVAISGAMPGSVSIKFWAV